MRKIFTLVAAASIACAANAQTVETFSAYNEDGTLKEELYVANPEVGNMSIVNISTASVKAEQNSGPVASYDNGPLVDGKLVPKYNNGWSQQPVDSKNNRPYKQAPNTESICFPFVQGAGNPADLDKVTFDPVIDSETGQPTGDYKAEWANAYYLPDGSNGVPAGCGTYLTFTPSVDGELVVLAWINKGGRCAYFVKGSDKKAIPYGEGGVKVRGWDSNVKYGEEDGADFNGFLKYQDNIQTKAQIALEKDPAAQVAETDNYILGEGGYVVGYFSLNVVANETYYFFVNSSQIGLNSYTFTPSGNVGLSTIAVDENAPVEYYNLQGVRIANPEHGLYIKRQGNKVTKVIL